jgi:hypothetical protein
MSNIVMYRHQQQQRNLAAASACVALTAPSNWIFKSKTGVKVARGRWR